jgi:hypothetical protein
MKLPVHVEPSFGTRIVDAVGDFVAVTERWEIAASIVSAMNKPIHSERIRLIKALSYWLPDEVYMDRISRTDPLAEQHWAKFYEHTALLRELGEDK